MWEDTFDDFEYTGHEEGELFTGPFPKEKIDTFLVLLIIISSTSIVVLAFKFRIFNLWIDFLQSSPFLRAAAILFISSAAFIVAGVIFRTILWLRYKPMRLEKGEQVDWPFVSVIMPALNEEELIERSIDSIFAANYPEDKLELICINDGSKDRTLFRMMRAKEKYRDRLKVINFKRHVGKRKALYVGLKEAVGEVIVTSDSDSKVGRSALRNIVLPLIREEDTGAVAGRVAVLNEKQNFLTRMLSIRYSVSFDFGRAYQSVYGAVFCCPGALTAYRKSVLELFIRKWVKQKFMKVKCTYGEDRALTTYILQAGFMTRYQSNAVVYTKVPSKFRHVNRMYVRWTRSYVRESVLFSRFMFSSYRPKHRVLPIFDFFFLNLLHPFHLLAIGIICYSFVVCPIFILRYVVFIIITSFFLSLYYLRTKRSLTFLYGIPYAIITAFCLWWIVPYAACTLKNQSWLTK